MAMEIKTTSFFNSAEVMKRLGDSERKTLSAFGALTRSDARRRIRQAVVRGKAVVKAHRKAGTFSARKVWYIPSKPGEAPRTRATGAPIKKILFGYEAAGESGFIFSGNVVIGYGLQGGRQSDVPARLEKGGEFRTRKGKTVKVAKRPDIVPAFDKIKRRMPAMFADSM